MKIQRISIKDNSFGKKLIESFEKTGFAIVSDMTMPSLPFAYKYWKEYFQLSLEEKLKNKFNPKETRQSGYFPYKSENAKDQTLPDLKEFYHIYDVKKDVPSQVYSVAVLFVHQQMMELGEKLLTYIDPELVKAARDGNTLTRVIYYPEIPKGEVGERAAAHQDINLITLLPASTNPGLQVLDKEGSWHDVGTKEGDIIVNVGDMLQMYTKNRLKSTTHRVINLEGDRLSMPMFVHPRSDFDLGEMTAGEYLTKRLKEIGLK